MNARAELPSPAMTRSTPWGLPRPVTTGLRWLLWLAFNAFALYLVVALYVQGQMAFALLGLVVSGIASYLFINRRMYAQRYIFPSVAGMLVFVIFPLLYTVGIGFTNYSGSHLLSQAQVERYHLNQTYLAGERFRFTLHQSPDGERLRIDKGEQGVFVSPPLTGEPDVDAPLSLQPAEAAGELGDALALREVIQRRKALEQWVMQAPDGSLLRLYGLREVAAVEPQYRQDGPGVLVDNRTGARLTADMERGFYVDETGKAVPPGFTVFAGFANFSRVLTEPSIREPFMQIFAWTFAFAGLTVVFTLALGLVLASLLQWELVRGKAFYRLMLILPYAVPAFISILVFRGLFNQNFGEINLLLDSLFGMRPDWFSDPATRRADVHILAATNLNLEEMVREGKFREDLLYRLNVITLNLPPMRERPEDVLTLAERFLASFVKNYGRPARGFSDAAVAALKTYRWPGNVRELRNVVERASIICPQQMIEVSHLGLGEQVGSNAPRIGEPLSLEALEKAHIAGVLSTSDTLDQAARILGIDASTLYRKRKQYGL